jgi:alkylhydroperoxidase family enzyme
MSVAFIAPPPRMPFYLRWGLRIAQRRTGQDLLPAQLLAWYPRAAVGSAVLESLIAHDDGRLTERTLKLVRMAVSFAVSCPFCIGLNSQGWDKLMTETEREAVQGLRELEGVEGFDERERLAIEFARRASETPLAFDAQFGERLAATFTERELVVLATTAAQVNYWARVIQSLGCPPE